MRKIFTLIISLVCISLSSLNAQAPDLNSFYQPGTIWGTITSEQVALHPDSNYARTFEISHDSVINSQTVHLVHYRDVVSSKLIGAIRIDSEKVYFRNLSPDSIYVRWPYMPSKNNPNTTLAPNTEYLHYDYNIGVGDTLHWKPGYQVVLKVDSVVADGIYLKRFHFDYYISGSTTLFKEYWIEGVGSNLGFLGSRDTADRTDYNYYGFTRTVRYCSPDHYYDFGLYDGGFYDGNCRLKPLDAAAIPSSSQNVTVSPNPAYTDDIYVKVAGGASIAGLTIYDMYGRSVYEKEPAPGGMSAIVSADLKPGVYFLKVSLSNDSVIVKQFVRQ